MPCEDQRKVCLKSERQEVSHFLIPSPVGSQGGGLRGEKRAPGGILCLSTPRPILCVEVTFPPPHIHISLSYRDTWLLINNVSTSCCWYGLFRWLQS